MMSYDYIQPEPLNVLVVLADADPNDTSMISGMRGHYALFCEEPVSAVIAVENGFSPDVTIIDMRLRDATRLAQKLINTVATSGLTCVALCHSTETDVSPYFTFRLTCPVDASELERLFLKVEKSSRQARAHTLIQHRPNSINDSESEHQSHPCVTSTERKILNAVGAN